MKCIVTGCAGFIGSILSEALVKEGHEVVGIDCFAPYYPREIKENNIKGLLNSENFSFVEKDVYDIENIDADIVFHLAAQPGVRSSWGRDFKHYANHNILATQHLLDISKDIKKFVFASSSSVYGSRAPFMETQNPDPISPYGVSKLCCENLCKVYSDKLNISIVRFFTVYGPRQRPDMAFNKFIKSATEKGSIEIYGDGTQIRDFTYVDDIVDGTIKSAFVNSGFEIFNIGNGQGHNLMDAVKMLEEILGIDLRVERKGEVKGDMNITVADISKARKILNYSPKTSLMEGLKKEVEWFRSNS